MDKKEFASNLRTTGTKGEAVMWKHVLKPLDLQFNRQHVIENYIVDFICRKLNLVIEIDGVSHDKKGEYDLKRQEDLEKLGYVVIRFEEKDVLSKLSQVKDEVYNTIEYLRNKKLED